MINKCLLISLLCFGLIGCTLYVARPNINPTIKFNNPLPQESHGYILIKTKDARENSLVGSRGIEGVSAPVIVSDNLAPMLKNKLEVISLHNGYVISENEKTSKQITATLLVLNDTSIYRTLPGATSKIEIAIEIIAKNTNKMYFHIYRFSKEKSFYFAKTEANFQEDLNNAFSDFLLQIADDNNLWLFLAK